MTSTPLVVAAFGLAIAIAPWASQAPDGLERVASDLGHADPPAAVVAPAQGYRMPGIEGGLSTSLSGLAGVAVVLGLAMLMVGGRRSAIRANAG